MFTARQRAQAQVAADAHVAAEVAFVLDEMLVDLEVWDSENKWRQYQRQLAAQAVEMGLLHSKVVRSGELGESLRRSLTTEVLLRLTRPE
jgi:hypothetical protein